ncbi:MAG TPA: sigma-54-dependent Fis family transcriptional regulator, partial [bacterium]|nr:sigma-54-dependent Fis family transcriptional regulator [bacterium]
LGHDPVTAASAARGLRSFAEAAPDLVVLDIGLPDQSGLDLLATMRERAPQMPVLIVTAHGNLQNAVDAKKAGATGYLVKPLDLEQLAATIRSLLHVEVVAPPPAPPVERDAPFLIGSSAAMQPAFTAIAHACACDVPVLITGPTGIGKSLAARIVHRHSARHAGPFVTLSCASLPESLLESELFGHERGAFTGADGQRIGHVERAAGGTLFLDEIGEVPMALQVKLLRCVEEKVITRVGGREDLPVDLRIVAATNQDLDAAVAAGRFREDLLYRLRVLEIELPPLRERGDDLPALCAFLLAQFERPARSLAAETMALLRRYEWPGNVRELRNVLEHAAAVCSGSVVLPAHLPDKVRRAAERAPAVMPGRLDAAIREWLDGRLHDGQSYDALHDELDGLLLRHLLPRYDGKPTLLARALGMNRATLRRKLRDYGIDYGA